MKYYEKNGTLYTANTPINSDDFVEITKDEYELKLIEIKVERVPPSDQDEWFIDVDMATEQDYVNALAEMGVELW